MKFSLSILSLCVSAVLAARNDCLDAERSNLENVCRSECAQDGAVAFSISNEETDDSCRCFPKLPESLGTYTGSGDENSGFSCFSMEEEATELLDYGDCVVHTASLVHPTKYAMKKCEQGEKKSKDCIVEKRYNTANVCHKECMKHNSVAFSFSQNENDDICRCYPPSENGEYVGGVLIDPHTHMTCYVMDGKKLEVLGYGDCVPSKTENFLRENITEHTMKVCPKIEKLLRGSVLA